MAKLIRLTHKIAIHTTVYNGRELYHLQFLPQAVSLETSGYTLICSAEFHESESDNISAVVRQSKDAVVPVLS
jgi:hypothetical protein